MTRGQIAVITENGVSTSIEFNGDMYMPTDKWAGYGQDVIDLLKKVRSKNGYIKAVNSFNKSHHNYNDCRTYDYDWEQHMLVMSKEVYFDKWFSDYVYMKNLTKTNKVVMDYNGKFFNIPSGKIAVINFGELELIV